MSYSDGVDVCGFELRNLGSSDSYAGQTICTSVDERRLAMCLYLLDIDNGGLRKSVFQNDNGRHQARLTSSSSPPSA